MARTAAYWQALAIQQVGGKPSNTEFELAFIYGTSGGVFTWEQNGVASAPIAFPPTAAALRVALEAIPTIGVGGAKVRGPLGGPYFVEMGGGNAGQEVAPPYIDGTQLIESQEVEVGVVSVGETPDYTTEAAEYWENHAEDHKSENHRFLLMKLDLIDFRLGKLTDSVDISTGQVNRVDEKSSQRIQNLERMRGRVEAAITKELNSLKTGSQKTSGGKIKQTTASGLPFGVMRDPRARHTRGRLK